MGRVSEGLSLSWCWTGHQMPNISSRRYLDNDYLVCLEIIMSWNAVILWSRVRSCTFSRSGKWPSLTPPRPPDRENTPLFFENFRWSLPLWFVNLCHMFLSFSFLHIILSNLLCLSVMSFGTFKSLNFLVLTIKTYLQSHVTSCERLFHRVISR